MLNEMGEKTDVSKKWVKDLFVAQFAKPSDLEEINLSQLTPFQRALLVTDGTVTRFIEAYTLSTVEVVLLNQETQILPTNHVWLEVAKGTRVIARQVILQTRQRAGQQPTVHTYATSLIVPNRTSPVIREGLTLEGKGLGQLLQRSGLETRRDLLWWGLKRPDDLPETLLHLQGEPFLSRTYRIVAEGRPIMLINEQFPFNEYA
jgi:chorismate-pyruvate lyase